MPKKAAELAKELQAISVSQFFRKNMHLLGFDNPRKALLTIIKEACDNSLDSCEEANILPKIKVELKKVDNGPIGEWGSLYTITVEDNGPGIMPKQVGNVFGKLLYGSKFHKLRQSRGQQGIGISASVLYSQLTTDCATKVWSWIKPNTKAYYSEVKCNVKANEPVIVVEKEEEEERDTTGVRVEFNALGIYYRGEQSIDTYLKQMCLANPTLQLEFKNGETGEHTKINNSSNTLLGQPKEIKPHPSGIDIGMLSELVAHTKRKTVKDLLAKDLSRVTYSKATTILRKCKIRTNIKPADIVEEEVKAIFNYMKTLKFMAPQSNCLVPIGEELFASSLKQLVNGAEFYTTITRPAQVYKGNPFQVEVGIAYGGDIDAENKIKLIRMANKVPLLYNYAAGAIAEGIGDVDWRLYGLAMPKGSNLPVGPAVIAVHVVSVWVPYTSEGKQSIAKYPEIVKEIKLACQECGRTLGKFVRKQNRRKLDEKKQKVFEVYIPILVQSLFNVAKANKQKEKVLIKNLMEKAKRV